MPPSPTSFDHQRSARRDLWVWAMLLVGAMFILTAHTVDRKRSKSPTWY